MKDKSSCRGLRREGKDGVVLVDWLTEEGYQNKRTSKTRKGMTESLKPPPKNHTLYMGILMMRNKRLPAKKPGYY